jgi:FixJ family two-component response regulator
VIFITGQDRAGMEEDAMQLGASAYLRKSVDEDTLLGAISQAMTALPNHKKERNRHFLKKLISLFDCSKGWIAGTARGPFPAK